MTSRVVVVTVTYGKRWQFLSKLVERVMHDPHVIKLIIIDNASYDKEALEKELQPYGSRIHLIRHEKNLGSAGGFARGIEEARKEDCEFVLLLDDDNVPEEGAIDLFLDCYSILSGKRVLSAFRPSIQDKSIFELPPKNIVLKKTFFDVWSLLKIKNFFLRFLGMRTSPLPGDYFPIVPTQGFVYGGAFLPIDAIRSAPLPDKELVLYGDDVEYSWGVLGVGYTSYLCNRPSIDDLDMSFESGDHILGLFNAKTSLFKVYFRIRNMVRISLRNTSQSKFAIYSSIVIWILGLCMLGGLRYGPTLTTCKRVWLILQAVYGGFITSASIPEVARLP